MKIKDIFVEDVTRDIPPVVYFHEIAPEEVNKEVSEYIITGGFPPTDSRHKRVEAGIHEQFVKLLSAVAKELRKPGGANLPGSWISGFYGSGKSIFAKLLGLSLDGLILPNKQPLSEALLSRDDSPNTYEFREAWQSLLEIINPFAVIFDIGSVARDNEHIHSAIKRKIQERLGYCPNNHIVADYELKLELDGKWDEFMQYAEETLGKSWEKVKTNKMAEDAFSTVMHKLYPERYTDTMSWIESRAGASNNIGSAVAETTKSIADMLNIRAPRKTLFIIVDEVFQYVHQNDDRTLKLQSFVSDLGQKLKGKVWLLATGQQKLEDTDDEVNVSKLKDRFPARFRVHLSATNIRDVVHKRLLKKNPIGNKELKKYFHENRADLKLNGYSCEAITEADFLEVYPLLPGHVDLLMQITSNLRLKSTRFKGDEHAIRGLLQLLGELFREQSLGEKELGELITIDKIYEVQKSALDADIQNSILRILSNPEVINDETAIRVAKTISLLELIQEQVPTTTKLISQSLYSKIGYGNHEPVIQKTLDKLSNLALISYSEKLGYKIQSSAGQEWQKYRDDISVTKDEISIIIIEKLKELVGSIDKPKFKGKAFPWAAWFSDERNKIDEKVQTSSEQAVVTIDFRYLSSNLKTQNDKWVNLSASDNLKNRLIWVSGNQKDLERHVRALSQSRNIINHYMSHIQSLSQSKQRLFYMEKSRCEELEKKVKDSIVNVFMDGNIFFRGRKIDKYSNGSAFATVLHHTAESILPDLFSKFVDIAVTPSELLQLLDKNLSGPSQKFMESNLGILNLDAGKYIPVCSGLVPTRIMQHIRDNDGCSGSYLFNFYGAPPYGHPPDIIKACLAGLLRAGKISIRIDSSEITSVNDPGTKNLFQKERDIKRADILLPKDNSITARDRIKICNFFSKWLKVDLDRENDAIADAVFHNFPEQVDKLQNLEKKYRQLYAKPDLPEVLIKLKNALDDCKRSRLVKPTVKTVKRNLDALTDGMQMLEIINAELTQKAIEDVNYANWVFSVLMKQLNDVNKLENLTEDTKKLEQQLKQEYPWRNIASLHSTFEKIEKLYRNERKLLIDRQEKKAEKIREKIKLRQGFEKLDANQSHKVLRPIYLKQFKTTEDATEPTLGQLRDTFITKLYEAEKEADERLDNYISDITSIPVVPVNLNLRGREIEDENDVENLITDLRKLLLSKLKDNIKIRLE